MSSRQSSKWLLWNQDTVDVQTLGAEDMRVKYNIDYLTKCSIFKRALVKCCFYKKLVLYFKI